MTEVLNSNVGLIPRKMPDTTSAWVNDIRLRSGRPELVKPNLLLRWATDTNYVLNRSIPLPGYSNKLTQTKAVMQVMMPSSRVPGIINWSVNETIDNIVSTASFEAINALPVSEIQTTLSSSITSDPHSTTITASYCQDSLFVLQKVAHDAPVSNYTDADGVRYNEANVKFRTFQSQAIPCADLSKFPDPRIPDDDDNDVKQLYDSTYWDGGYTAVGNYFILIDDEVIRVTKKGGAGNNTFYVLPGGRGVNGILQNHSNGATVKLLGFGPSTGEYAGFGYLAFDDYKPQKCLLRPGTCLTSYEGYGNFAPPLTHGPNRETDQYEFTGYWFVSGLENSLGEDGVPRVKVDLKSAGNMLDQQKITLDTVQRMKTQFGQWKVENQGIFGAAGHTRNIAGDWVDFSAWDPTTKDAYPLKIKTEMAQHKAFFDHMRSTENGKTCLICREERAEYLKRHPSETSEQELMVARAVGKHVYKESIRVMRTPQYGPIQTYIRLMGTMAAAAWDHPAYGLELAQMFTKIPASLFDAIRDINAGLIYCGQLDYRIEGDDPMNFEKTDYDDRKIVTTRKKLSCPFETTYDKAPWSQPMVDLAEANDLTLWINREGYPVMMPKGAPLRSQFEVEEGYNQFFTTYGASLTSYSHSIAPESVITQCWVTANTALESTFTLIAGGTGTRADGQVMMYSGHAGNKEGLILTSGVQQVDTLAIDNQIFGLDWDTHPPDYGAQQEFDGDIKVMNAKPSYPNGAITLRWHDPGDSKKSDPTTQKHPNMVRAVQRLINFMLIRHYIAPVQDAQTPSKWYFTINEDGKYGYVTDTAVRAIQTFLRDPLNVLPGDRPTALGSFPVDGIYGRTMYLWVRKWFQTANHFIKTDIWWYVINNRPWEEYVAAMTGFHIPLKKSNVKATSSQTNITGIQQGPQWSLDDKATYDEIMTWQRAFYQAAANQGNRRVDDSINKASLRSISCNLANPRIQPGDTIWCEIPGFLGARDALGRHRPPYTNGIYVTQLSRQMDLSSGTYTATYSGYRARPVKIPNKGFDLIG